MAGNKGAFAVQVVDGPLFEDLKEEDAWDLFFLKIRTENRVLLFRGGRNVAEFRYGRSR